MPKDNTLLHCKKKKKKKAAYFTKALKTNLSWNTNRNIKATSLHFYLLQHLNIGALALIWKIRFVLDSSLPNIGDAYFFNWRVKFKVKQDRV